MLPVGPLASSCLRRGAFCIIQGLGFGSISLFIIFIYLYFMRILLECLSVPMYMPDAGGEGKMALDVLNCSY